MVEPLLRSGEEFVPNDTQLSPAGPQLLVVTGPNMSGKSTYLRQVALIVLLAQMGSFVPAESARVGVVDRVFTRVGASDRLARGESTFMVEMRETAEILAHASRRSLVILDEIGRGTSTLDGLSLAWAIAEHLAARRCRCLFATHYHELTSLAESHDNVTNLNVTVREWQDEIVFLHRIAPGATDRSYGIHVAKIAGLPEAVVGRAHELLGQLAVNHSPASISTPSVTPPDNQLPLFTEYVSHPALEELRGVEIDRMSPLDAFDLLRRLRAQLGDENSEKNPRT